MTKYNPKMCPILGEKKVLKRTLLESGLKINIFHHHKLLDLDNYTRFYEKHSFLRRRCTRGPTGTMSATRAQVVPRTCVSMSVCVCVCV